jgi:hypothetical protein
MNTLIFAPKHNSRSRSDATGAFQPEARRYMQVRGGGRIVHIDNRWAMPERADEVLREIVMGPGNGGRWDTVAFFCHGLSDRIQLGFTLRNVKTLARALAESSSPNVRIPLYACSTASTLRRLLRLGKGPGGDGGFADQLRDELCRQGLTGCRVMAHVTSGHCTLNPHARFFDGRGSDVGGQGGEYVVRPPTDSANTLWSMWRAGLKTDLRFHFPHMEIADIHATLLAGQTRPTVEA